MGHTSVGTPDFFDVWNMGVTADAERLKQRYIQAGLDKIRVASPTVVKRFKKLPSIGDVVTRWLEENDIPQHIVGTLNHSTAKFTIPDTQVVCGAAISASTFPEIIRYGTILERVSDGLQIKVTTAQGSLPTASAWQVDVAAHAGGTLTTDSGDVEYEIINESWNDLRDMDFSRALGRTWRKVGTQIFAEALEMTKTRMNLKMTEVKNEFDHQMARVLYRLNEQVEKAVLRSKPYYSGGVPKYGDEAEVSYLCGVRHWPILIQAESANTNIYVNASSAPLTKTMVDNLVYNAEMTEFVDFNKGDWIALCHPLTHQAIQDWDIDYRRTTAERDKVGFSVSSILTKRGKEFPLVTDRWWPKGWFNLVDCSQIGWGFFNNDEVETKEVPTKGRYKQWLLSCQAFGTVVRRPRQSILTVYGLPTS